MEGEPIGVFPYGRALVPRRASRFRMGDDEYVVLLMPELAPISKAEQEVTTLIIEGLTNAEIAVARGTHLRTVANQVASIFRKMGIGSRAELVASFPPNGISDEGRGDTKHAR